MRKFSKIDDMQLELGQTDIPDIKFSLKSRDEIPQLLMGLQRIFCNDEHRAEVAAILEEEIDFGDMNNGRPGMPLWQILVLGTIRVVCGWDWDKLVYMANQHIQIRQMMGVGVFDNKEFSLQNVKDNVSLFTPEALERINALVVGEGHSLVKKNDEPIKARCDSFVLKTNVHFPTDFNLLLDAMRKLLFLLGPTCVVLGISGWRKYKNNFNKIKNLYHVCRKLRHSTSQNEQKRLAAGLKSKEATEKYINFCRGIICSARQALDEIPIDSPAWEREVAKIEKYLDLAGTFVSQIERRVILDEIIPHEEKVFSIFQPHTEWISKGKAGVPVELGVKVCVVEDQFGFILSHRVMFGENDVDVAVPMVKAALALFPDMKSCSFDKGFWSKGNYNAITELGILCVMLKKGKRNAEEKERENSAEFIELRHKHSAVESAINALENHGLDRCPDSGVDGFKRYVGLAVLGRNLQKLGAVIQQKKRDEEARRKKKRAWSPPAAAA